MPDLNISQKNIHTIFAENNYVKFLIPDYQRAYSWELEQCETLWEDFVEFAIPGGNADDFDDMNDKYFLGTFLTFINDSKQSEIIDGQQRLTTLLLLLRAFYDAFGNVQSQPRYEVSACIWQIDKKTHEPNKAVSKLKSEVATEDDLAEFQKIMELGTATKDNKSNYAENYRYFQKKIAEFKQNYPDNFSDLVDRILHNCIMLPIETTSQNTAFRIFTTLNDRGLPLSDSDIFKAQFYKFYREQGKQEKENFVARWKDLEEFCKKNFHPRTGTPLDDLFMRYMYYLLAKSGTKSDTFHGLRAFYEQNNYAVLQSGETFEDLVTLADFWQDVFERDEERFSNRVLKKLYVLSYCPYSIWSYIISLYFMSNRDENNLLVDEKFYNFIDIVTLMFLMYAVTQSGVQAVRRPFFLEFQNIFHGLPVTFKDSQREKKFFTEQLANAKFSNTRPITRAMLAWWAFEDSAQNLPPLGMRLEIEHIYAKKRHEFYPLQNAENLELLGNKLLLEKRINIRAADYKFTDKKKFYLGFGDKAGTEIVEARQLAESKDDFFEQDILERNAKIFDRFIARLENAKLLK